MTADVRRVVSMLAAGSLSISAAMLGATAAARAQSDQIETLGPGDHHQRDLATGQRHVYDIAVDAGQFLHAVVAPQGIDVAVSLTAPDGRELLANDWSSDHVVPETMMIIAETKGRYRVIVKPAVEGALAGRYAIHVEALRPATPEDAIRARVMRTFEAGMRLRRGTQPTEWKQAVGPLQDAVEGFREVGDREHEARALLEAAANGNNLLAPEARDLANRALAIYRALGDEIGAARAIGMLGYFYMGSGDSAEALRWLTDSLSLNRKVGNATQEASSLVNIGIVHARTGQSERAQDAFLRALALARTLHLTGAVGFALNNLGIVTKTLGDYRLSLSYYEQALSLARSTANSTFEATILNNLGNLYRLLGEPRRALTTHEEALTLARRTGSAENEARALNTLGSTYYRLGEFQKALDHHDQALAIRRQIGDLFGEGASRDGAGQAWHRLGNSERAIEQLREALRIRRAISERESESDTLMHLALVERDRGNLTAALDHMEAAVQLTNTLRGQVVSPDLRATFVAAEHERYELYIDVLMLLHQQQSGAGFDRRAIEANEAGRARVLLESLLEARIDIRQGIDPALLQRERALHQQLDSASTRLSRLLSRQSDVNELAAARALLENLSDEQQQLQVRIRRESPDYAAITQPEPLMTSVMQREIVDAETVLLEYALGEKRSWLWTVTPSGIASFELPPRSEIEPLARHAYELLSARQPRPGERATARARRVADADTEWRRQSTVLARMLIGPAARHLGSAWRGRRLLIVAPDVLQYVPFAALSDPAIPGQPLVVDHEVISLPSASVLALVRQQAQGRPQPSRQLAVLADPVFEADDPRVASRTRQQPARMPSGAPGDPEALAGAAVARALRSVNAISDIPLPRLTRLPFSRQEAQAISALVPIDRRLTAVDFEANRATATNGELGGYRMVHFATHGFLNSEQPELSGLVLSLIDRNGKAQDGFLRLSDIYNMRLPAELVVLSACQTALGKEIRGEGLIGLTRGFLYAGARSVVASLWKVDDLATAELMRLFYSGMLKDNLRPAAALRAAQRELAREPRWASPFFWSGFVLQGEWR
jgi:CHAT domain-containing protein/Tfp pilus assembly protein PilF